MKYLTALPVFNEAKYVTEVLDEVTCFSPHVLVVDDGSTDGTSQILQRRTDVRTVRHQQNKGYGAALMTAFDYAAEHKFDVVVMIDCDGQHEPQRIPRFVASCQDVDIVSGSRYLKRYSTDSAPPPGRRFINQLITAELNEQLGFGITDAFCGFKAYRVEAVKRLQLTETGYAMPLELWVQAAAHNLRIIEIPVPLIYLDEDRSFGGVLDDSDTRLKYYRQIIDESLQKTGRVERTTRRSGPTSMCGERA
jgi:dolichol-phosphate mannosyltransferase